MDKKMKLDYKKIYEQYEKLPWFLKGKDLFGFGPNLYFANLEKEAIEELNAVAKAKYPKRKKVTWEVLSEEETNPTIEKYKRWIKIIWDKKSFQADKMNDLLYSLAATVEIIPSEEYFMLQSSGASAYNSQGWGANKYAENALERYKKVLEDKNIEFEIRKKPEWDDAKCDRYEFQLWGKLEPWRWDALLRCTKYSLLEWAVGCWRGGVNPKVYNPYLPDAIYDASLEAWNK
jgi:hypothetical protein